MRRWYSRSVLSRVCVAFMAALAVSPAVAWAAPCDDAVVDPVTIGLIDGGFDRGRAACQRAELGARLVGRAAVDDLGERNGVFDGDLLLGGRTTYGPIEWGLGLRLLAVSQTRSDAGNDTDTGYGPVEAHIAY